MPKIQRKQYSMPKINIPVPSVGQRSSQASGIPAIPSAAASQTKSLVDSMQRSIEAISKMRDFREENIATIQLDRELAQLRAQAEQGDIAQFSDYSSKVDEVVASKTNQLTSPTLRAKAAASFTVAGMKAKNEMLNDYNKRVARESYASFVTRFLDLEQQYSVSDADSRDVLSAQADALIGAAYDEGLITKDKLFEMRKGYKRKWQKSWAENYIEMSLNGDNPDAEINRQVLDGLSDLTEKDKSDLITKSNERIKAAKKAAEDRKLRETINNEFTLTMAIAEGQASPLINNEVIDMMADGQISVRYGEAMLAALADPAMRDGSKDVGSIEDLFKAAQESGRDKGKEFKDMVDAVFNSTSKDVIRNVVIDILERKAKGQIEKDHLRYLLKAANHRMHKLRALRMSADPDNLTAAGITAGRMAGDLLTDDAAYAYDSGKHTIDEFLAGAQSADPARVYAEFLRQTADDSGKAPEAAQRAIDMERALSNPLYLQYRDKEFFPTPFGPRKITGFDVDGTPLVEL